MLFIVLLRVPFLAEHFSITFLRSIIFPKVISTDEEYRNRHYIFVVMIREKCNLKFMILERRILEVFLEVADMMIYFLFSQMKEYLGWDLV